MAFSLDTSFFIQGWNRYPPDIFPSFWGKVEHFIEKGEFVAILAVKDELSRLDDDVFKWTDAHKKMYIDYDERTLEIVTQLLAEHEGIVAKRKDKTSADAFVIALASNLGYSVVTEEHVNKPNGIPIICNQIGVPCMNTVDLMRKLRLSF